MMTSSPFRFLDLPKELRLMVYEHLTTRTVSFEIVAGITLTDLKLPGISILGTCKLINEEASPILHPRIEEIEQSDHELGYC